MKAPEKIYIQTNAGEAFSSKWTTIPFRDFENTEYIRKNYVDEMLKTAEDHAYFAGQEKFREELMEWAKENIDSLGRLSYGELVNKLNSM